MTDLAALLQLADAAFPAGGFGHSFGLETAIVDGRVHDGTTLRVWIESYLLDSCATLDGTAMALVLRDGVSVERLDERLAAAQPNAEIRRANAHLARATLDTYLAMGIDGADMPASFKSQKQPRDCDESGREASSIRCYRSAIAAGRCLGIHALAAALGYRAIGAPAPVALEAHGATIVTACASVAARAVPLGQRDVARIRWSLRTAIAAFVARALSASGIDDLRASAVACEIDGLRHRRLPARLFAS